ncbi:TIGR03943 family protein [Streptomyces sp. NPDC052682]|uniref:TIGR03943 family putative permease subunit n=1 Tax=Streptomyces sp. NPDC052682 TaxID=3154954 RepID=UPI0034454D6E
MRRYGPAVLLALTGAAIWRVSLFSDLYLRYVRPGLRPFLLVSGALLILLAAAVAALARGQRQAHSHGPRAAWLLTLPALALLLFPPPALGSYSAERESAQRSSQGVVTFPALPAGDVLEMSLNEFTARAFYDSRRSLQGRTVRLTGFVTRDGDGTWYVTRLLVSCCAADATTVKAEVRGAAGPPADTWVTVTGTWHPEGAPGSDEAWPPVVDAAEVRRVRAPANPYEGR